VLYDAIAHSKFIELFQLSTARVHIKFLLHCALSLAAQCIFIGPVCLQRARGQAGRCVWLCGSVTTITQAESIIAAVSWLALRRRQPTSCNVSSTQQHEFSRTRSSSTGDSLIFGDVSYTGSTLSTGFGSESASRCSDISTRWLLNTCRSVDLLPTRLRHFWSWPPAIGWLRSSRLPTCETCYVRRTFIYIRRPFNLELTSCSS